MSLAEDEARYNAAAHAIQTGVAFIMDRDRSETDPKHLRVGINCRAADQAALARLLIDKGIITNEEYYKSLADEMERERDRYKQMLQDRYGATTIELI